MLWPRLLACLSWTMSNGANDVRGPVNEQWSQSERDVQYHRCLETCRRKGKCGRGDLSHAAAVPGGLVQGGKS